MRRVAVLLVIALALLTVDSACADIPTSPAGVSDEMPATLPLKALVWARSFRGNALPLGVLTASVLLVAAGLGVYTIALVYRRPTGDEAH